MEASGASTLATGSELGGRSAEAGKAMAQPLYSGGMAAAASNAKADAYNPWATAITGVANNPQLMSALGGMFSGGNPMPTSPISWNTGGGGGGGAWTPPSSVWEP